MIFALPYPPSANRYWRTVRGRPIVSAQARAYKRQVQLLLKASGLTPFEGTVKVTLSVYRPRRIGDLDNTQKVLLDSLKGLAFEDDSQVVEIHARRMDDKDNPRVIVIVEPAQ